MQARWTQDEAIAFECARECITDVMGICSAEIAEEEAKTLPSQSRIEALEARLHVLSQERAELSLKDHEKIAMIRAKYGAYIRAYREV